MNQSILEERIRDRAEKRFKELLAETRNVIASNPLLDKLRIFIAPEQESGKHRPYVCLHSGQYGYCPNTDLFGSQNDTKLLKECTDFLETKEALVQQFVQEETDDIMSKLDVLRAFIEAEPKGA